MTHRNDPDYDWPSLLKGETSQSCLVVKYGELSLRLCIMPRKILLHIWYIRLKYDRVRHNCSRSSRDAVSNEPLHDHSWCSVDDTLVMVPVKNLSPCCENAHRFLHGNLILHDITWVQWWQCVSIKRVKMICNECEISSNHGEGAIYSWTMDAI
jgi:hypothetical protein